MWSPFLGVCIVESTQLFFHRQEKGFLPISDRYTLHFHRNRNCYKWLSTLNSSVIFTKSSLPCISFCERVISISHCRWKILMTHPGCGQLWCKFKEGGICMIRLPHTSCSAFAFFYWMRRWDQQQILYLQSNILYTMHIIHLFLCVN